MTIQDIIALIGGILILIVFISYEVYTRAYSQGFKEGLDMGKKIEKIDMQAERNSEE